jgi:hypothetical protein
MCPFTWFGCLTEEVVDPRLTAIDTDLNADRKSAVPLDRQDAVENAEDAGSGFWLDIHPPTDWHDCPDCDTRLSTLSLFHTNDDVLAVTDACLHDDCFARWVWETQTDELQYRGETEVVAIGDNSTE